MVAVTGGAEFAKFAADLLRVASGVDIRGQKAVERVGQGALAMARSIAPTDSGDLRSGLRLTRKGTVAILESSEVYSAFQEFGTSRMAPNPFIGPAALEWGPRLVAEVEGIRDEIVKDL